MSTVHMICGPIGAGKTTVARRLAERHRAVRFSLDEWVMQLFGSEAPATMVFQWWADRCARCRKRIWFICEELLRQDIDVILDFGFPGIDQRDEYRQLALQLGALVRLHVVTADPEARWNRVQRRNQHQGETFALVVTEEMFAGSEHWWEPPTPGELDAEVRFHSSDAIDLS